MQRVAEYLAEANKFERMAHEAKDEGLKDSFMKQASAYKKLAIDRARKLGLPEAESALGISVKGDY